MKGEKVDRVLEVLGFGPMKLYEIAHETGLDVKQVQYALRGLTDAESRLGKRVFVKEWVKRRTVETDKVRHCPAAVYALGSKKCAARPRPAHDAYHIRIKRLQSVKRMSGGVPMRASSVFLWAAS